LLVGISDPDDAAIWKIDDDRALVVTTDFFTPVVDDPYDYGAIAAANSLSDVYAMGGKPFLALNIVGLPKALPVEAASEILRGGAEVAINAGVVIAGGHSIQDEEPKYGLIVVGFVDPEKVITKTGAKPGDKLVLTKPLGFGVTTTALKQGKASTEDVEEVISWMKKLNKIASELALKYGVRGGTDITGYSFLGHSYEIADASKVTLKFNMKEIPFTKSADKYAEMWTFPGGTSDNRAFFGKHVTFSEKIEEKTQMLLFDSQTSGGLLLAVPEDKLDDFLTDAKKLDQPVWIVGDVIEGDGKIIVE
jgi:selenide,water dikinase